MNELDYINCRVTTKQPCVPSLDSYGPASNTTPNEFCHWAGPILSSVYDLAYSRPSAHGSLVYVGNGQFLAARHSLDDILGLSRRCFAHLGGSVPDGSNGTFYELELGHRFEFIDLDLVILSLKNRSDIPEIDVPKVTDEKVTGFHVSNGLSGLVVGFGSRTCDSVSSFIKNDVPVKLLNRSVVIPKKINAQFKKNRGKNWREKFLVAYSKASGPTNSDSGAPLVAYCNQALYLLGIEIDSANTDSTLCRGDHYSLYIDLSQIPFLNHLLKL